MQDEARLHVKLSKGTIELLRNFSNINKSILIDPGNFAETISVNKNIIAASTIRETLPTQLAIYDLPLFLGALSLFKSPTLFFPDDKKVVIYDEDTKGKTTFYYSDPEIIGKVPEFNPDLADPELFFDLPQQDLDQLMQASKVYGVDDLCIYGYEGEFSICVKDKKNETSNVFSLPLKKVIFADASEMTVERRNFCYCFKVENLKLLPGTYHVTVSRRNIANFTSLSNSSLNYFIALEPNWLCLEIYSYG